MAIRDSAAFGSPCEPVARQTTSWDGNYCTSESLISVAGRHVQEAEPLRDLRVLVHAAADKRHLAIELRRQVDDDLQAIQARRERRDDDLAFRAGEDLFEGVLDVRLRPV